jgi:hypothetical protein
MCVRVPTGQAFEYLTVIDCRAPHEAEVTARGVIPGTSKWPGELAVDEAATKQCEPAFARYVGVTVEDSRLDFDYFVIDAAGWKTGPHTLICLVYDPSADHLTKSVRNARE